MLKQLDDGVEISEPERGSVRLRYGERRWAGDFRCELTDSGLAAEFANPTCSR